MTSGDTAITVIWDGPRHAVEKGLPTSPLQGARPDFD